MDNTPRAVVMGSMRQYGDRAIAESIEGAFINAELARQIGEYKRKANLWDLHVEVSRKKCEARLAEIKEHAEAAKSPLQRFLSRLR